MHILLEDDISDINIRRKLEWPCKEKEHKGYRKNVYYIIFSDNKYTAKITK